MKFTGRTFFFLWIPVTLLVLAGSAQLEAQAQDGSSAQGATDDANSAGAKAAAAIPAQHNRARRSGGKLMEIQILGVGFSEGHVVVCSKEIGNQRQPEARTRIHDVRVVSTASHEWNEDMPALKAGRFNVPEEVVARGTYLRIEGKVK